MIRVNTKMRSFFMKEIPWNSRKALIIFTLLSLFLSISCQSANVVSSSFAEDRISSSCSTDAVPTPWFTNTSVYCCQQTTGQWMCLQILCVLQNDTVMCREYDQKTNRYYGMQFKFGREEFENNLHRYEVLCAPYTWDSKQK